MPARAKTPEERRAALDRRLNASLAAFDVQLRKEEQKIAPERDARQAIALAALDSQPSRKSLARTSGEPSGRGAMPVSDSPRKGTGRKRGGSQASGPGDLQSDRSAGETPALAVGNGLSVPEIPDGNDDDIIARRLRKAAEQEPDPEVRGKLWREYVEYKKNTDAR